MLPGPTNVPDRVMRAMIKPIIGHRGAEFHRLYEMLEENLHYLFQTENDVYVLTSSGTGGMECAIGNLFKPGDRVIVPVFGVFSERVREKLALRGVKPVELAVKWGDAPTAKQVREVAEREGEAKAIVVVYNETSTGVTVRELPEIGTIAREKGMLLVVDAISILGGDQLPVNKWNVDVCITGSQKCIACPPGLAMVSVSEQAWSVIEKVNARPYYFDLVKMREFKARRETPFTPALPLFQALNEALGIIREEGLENRFRRHRLCAEAFYNAMEALDLSPFAKEGVRSNTVIAVNVPRGVEGASVRSVMRERYDVVIAGGMGRLKHSLFRIGCMGVVSQAEVLTTVNALENALKDVGYAVKSGAGVEAARQTFLS